MFESLEVIVGLYLHEVVERRCNRNAHALVQASLFLADNATRKMRVLSSIDDLSHISVDYGHGLVGYVAEHQVMINIADACERAVPLKVDEETGFKTRSVSVAQ